MRKGLVCVVSVLAVAAVAQARPQAQPTLRVVRSSDAFGVRGTSFHPRERVRVTVIATERRTKTVWTTTAGKFSADFAPALVDKCSGSTIRAIGGRGDRALLKIPQRACSSG